MAAENFGKLLDDFFEQHSIDVLNDRQKCRALLNDFSEGNFAAELRLLNIVIDAGFHAKILEATEMDFTAMRIIEQLETDFFITKDKATEIITVLFKTFRNYDIKKDSVQQGIEPKQPISSTSNTVDGSNNIVDLSIYEEKGRNMALKALQSGKNIRKFVDECHERAKLCKQTKLLGEAISNYTAIITLFPNDIQTLQAYFQRQLVYLEIGLDIGSECSELIVHMKQGGVQNFKKDELYSLINMLDKLTNMSVKASDKANNDYSMWIQLVENDPFLSKLPESKKMIEESKKLFEESTNRGILLKKMIAGNREMLAKLEGENDGK